MNAAAATAALCLAVLCAALQASQAQLDWDAMTNQQALQTGDVSSCTNVCNNVVRTQANEPKLLHLSGITWRHSLHQFPDHD